MGLKKKVQVMGKPLGGMGGKAVQKKETLKDLLGPDE